MELLKFYLNSTSKLLAFNNKKSCSSETGVFLMNKNLSLNPIFFLATKKRYINCSLYFQSKLGQQLSAPKKISIIFSF